MYYVAYVQAIIEFLPYTGQHVQVYGFDDSSNQGCGVDTENTNSDS
jgi:hypothetical protein